MENREIGFIGFGDLGKQVASMLIQEGYKEHTFNYFDDTQKGERSFRFKDYSQEKFKGLEFIICLGYKHLSLKNSIIKDLIRRNRQLLTFIHKSSFINPSARLGKGVIIFPMCNVDQYVEIGDGVLLNNSVTVSHNSTLGSSGYYSPGVVLSGNVNVGSASFLGTGTLVSNGIQIGKNCFVGIGTVVTTNLTDDAIAIGNPLRILDHPLQIK